MDTEKTTKTSLDDMPTGVQLIHDPVFNKGTAFTESEREVLGLTGLLPPVVNSIQEQVMRVMENLRRKPSNLEKYIFLAALQDRNMTLFYRVLVDHLEELMPIIYTPTVGQACQQYVHIYRRPKGIFISLKHKGQILKILQNWPTKAVRIIVVTDGERILGLGDLGVAGMGIPVGKLSLYTACSGIHPSFALPVTVDVGTNNVSLLNDPLYFGLRHRRIRGAKYDALIDEFVAAVNRQFPGVLIQFEDFGNLNALRLLQKYRNQVCAFNDDIQGTASVVLAGLCAAIRMTSQRLTDQKILFLGAGEAGIGIGELITTAMMDEGLTEAEARRRCWYFDSRGLVVRQRKDLAPQKRAFAHNFEHLHDFLSCVEAINPTSIMGVAGQAGAFTQHILETMARINNRPIIFALSNPTSRSECTAEEAYTWTAGRAIFASGSPFGPVTIGDKTFEPGLSNNAYIFPGVGLGVIASRARHVTDDMFLAAAKVLVDSVSAEDLSRGSLFPPLKTIRELSLSIACEVAKIAYNQGLATGPEPKDLAVHIQAMMYEPVYPTYA